MGQRQNKTEIVYGDDCQQWPDPTKTPKYVYARFSKMIKCPEGPYTPPNDRVFKLTQVDGVPCRWCYVSARWLVQFEVPIPQPRVYFWLDVPFGGPMYFGDLPFVTADEGYIYHNEIQECNLEYGAKGGIATVTWGLETMKLMGLLNIKAAYDLFMEMRPLDDGSKVYKYCNLRDATNISIKYEPD